MSTRKKVPRQPKSKATAPLNVEIIAPVVIDAPVAAAPKRIQVGKAIGINIAVARTRRHLDKLNLNAGPCAYIDALKEQIAPYTAAQKQLTTGKITHLVEKDYQYVKDGKTLTGKKIFEEERDITESERAAAQAVVDKLRPSVPAWEAKLEAFSRERSRFSHESPVVLAVVCDELTKQLVSHAVASAVEAKKKTVQIAHLYGAGVEKLSLYPLVSGLNTFKQTAASTHSAAVEAAHAAALAAALKQAEKDFKKKYDVRAKRVKKAAAEASEPLVAAEPEVIADEEEEDDGGASFKMYVGQACKDAIADPAHKTIRFSTDIRDHLSTLLAEFIGRISAFVAIAVVSAGTKTVTGALIMSTIEALLIDGHAKVEKIDLAPVKAPSAESLKAQAAAKAKAKADGVEFTPIELPLVEGFATVRTVSYPTSGYDSLNKIVTEKLGTFAALKPVKPEEDLVNDIAAELIA